MACLKQSAFAAILMLPLSTGAAFAVGSDWSGSDEPPKKTKTTTECASGEVWDDKQQKCVAAKESRLDEGVLFDAARELAHFGRPEDALRLLALMPDQNHPDVLTYKGFASRKAGDMDAGLAFYANVLERAPDHVRARSYLGLALVELGRIDEARDQLREIRRRAGPVNLAYIELDRALDGIEGGY